MSEFRPGDDSGRALRLGMLTPSSNTVLEPAMAAMTAGATGLTLHVSRFRVTRIALSAEADAQFDQAPMIAAAELLADARCDAIAWNGTSAGWLGFQRDEALCAAVTAATGVPTTSAVLGFRDLFAATGVRRVGLVTPYTADVQARIMANWAAAGFPCTAERGLGLSENFAFAEVGEERVEAMIRAVAREGCDAAAIVCTNMRGAGLADRLERELGLPVYDSVSVTLRAALALAGADLAGPGFAPLRGWGSVFAQNRGGAA
jgi:maleate isomerase